MLCRNETHPCSDQGAHEAVVLVSHVVARLSSGPGPPPEDEAEGLERPELFGTNNLD